MHCMQRSMHAFVLICMTSESRRVDGSPQVEEPSFCIDYQGQAQHAVAGMWVLLEMAWSESQLGIQSFSFLKLVIDWVLGVGRWGR